MGNIGDPITQVIPIVGTSGTTYAQNLVDFLTEVRNRLTVKVPITSVTFASLDMNNNAISNLRYAHFYAQTLSPTTPVGSIQNFGGDLFWVSPSGPIQITSGNTLNAAALAGIGGDYGGGNPAQERFVDADARYYFYDDFGAGTWASIKAKTVDIPATSTGAANVKLAWSGTSSYTLIFPIGVPASGVDLVTLDSTGQMATASGAHPTNDLIMGANTNIQVSGSGYWRSGNNTQVFALSTNRWEAQSTPLISSSTQPGAIFNAAGSAYFPLENLPYKNRIQSFFFTLSTGSISNVTYTWATTDGAGGTFNVHADSVTSTASTVTLTVAAPTLLGDTVIPYIKVTTGAAVAARFISCRVTYDIP